LKFLLDTCVISELVKARPQTSVIEWIDSTKEEQIYLSSLTIGEIFQGIELIPNGKKKDKFLNWVNIDLLNRFQEKIIPITFEVAQKWGEISGVSEKAGKKLPVIDSLIAATGITFSLIVVTRNIKDLERTGAKILNPWSTKTF